MSYGYDSGSRRPAGGAGPGANPFGEPEREPTEEERIISQILDVQQESKSSTQRSLALLYQTEEIGTATAEQLIEQGERLDRIEGTVKKIDTDLKQSQKHINGLKSVFGGMTNWWQSRKEKKGPKEETPEPTDSGLRSAVKQSEMGAAQQQRSVRAATPSSGSAPRAAGGSSGGMTAQAMMEQHEAEIEDDLNEMGMLTDRLKYMAVAMGEEMDKQNVQIDRITDKVGRTDATMSGQNKQMNKILKK